MSPRIWCAFISTGRPYESPNPTTGEALYELGKIPKHEKLFREVGGDKEDKLVPRDDAHVHLTEDEHFYSQKVFAIFVNTDEHDIDEKEITYAQVVELYLGDGGKPVQRVPDQVFPRPRGEPERHVGSRREGEGERWHAL